jgi:hypothetical protein
MDMNKLLGISLLLVQFKNILKLLRRIYYLVVHSILPNVFRNSPFQAASTSRLQAHRIEPEW